jgi:hypothetical protein
MEFHNFDITFEIMQLSRTLWTKIIKSVYYIF